MAYTTYKTTGGGNESHVFALNSVWALTTSTDLIFDRKFSSAFAGHEKSKNLDLTITGESLDSAVTNFFRDYLWETIPAAEKYEDSVEAGNAVTDPSSSTTPCGIVITYSGKSSESPAKRLIRVFPFRLEGGDYTMEAEKTIRINAKMIAIQAGAAIGVPATAFDTNLISSPALITIPINSFGTSFWLDSV